MGKQVDQATRWETRVVKMARSLGRVATRLPKTGKKHEPDLVIWPDMDTDVSPSTYPLVAWERWNGKMSNGRRRATRMFTMDEETFRKVLDNTDFGWYVQCKSTQVGSLSAWLEGLAERLESDSDIY